MVRAPFGPLPSCVRPGRVAGGLLATIRFTRFGGGFGRCLGGRTITGGGGGG